MSIRTHAHSKFSAQYIDKFGGRHTVECNGQVNLGNISLGQSDASDYCDVWNGLTVEVGSKHGNATGVDVKLERSKTQTM